MEQAFYSDFYGKAAQDAGIQAPRGVVPAEVSVTFRENQENEYLFIQNYARETKAVPVPAEYEVIYGAADEIMQPLATRVLKKKKQRLKVEEEVSVKRAFDTNFFLCI